MAAKVKPTKSGNHIRITRAERSFGARCSGARSGRSVVGRDKTADEMRVRRCDRPLKEGLSRPFAVPILAAAG